MENRILPNPIHIRLLKPVPNDLEYVQDITNLINQVYKEAEKGLWVDSALRTSSDEVIDLIKRGSLVCAFLKSRIVGCMKVDLLHSHMAEFGMLAVDPEYRNHKVGSRLVAFAESHGSDMGASWMQLEILQPRHWNHSFKEYLKAWYGRLGYEHVETGRLEEHYPFLEPLLATDCKFDVYRKQLNETAFCEQRRVLTSTRLTATHLEDLFSNRALAVHISGFFDPNAAKEAGQKVAHHDELEQYFYEIKKDGKKQSLPFGVSRFGVSFNTTFYQTPNSPENTRYFKNSLTNIRKIRRFFPHQYTPLDKFRLELDEVWHKGGTIATINGAKMFAGIIRVTDPHAEILESKPHVDVLPQGFPFENQYSANIYLTTPEEEHGGQLTLWNMDPIARKDVDDFNRNTQDWMRRMGKPIFIKPKPGDLVLINTRRPHAVTQFTKGTRVSIQSFFTHDQSGSLRLWC